MNYYLQNSAQWKLSFTHVCVNYITAGQALKSSDSGLSFVLILLGRSLISDLMIPNLGGPISVTLCPEVRTSLHMITSSGCGCRDNWCHFCWVNLAWAASFGPWGQFLSGTALKATCRKLFTSKLNLFSFLNI